MRVPFDGSTPRRVVERDVRVFEWGLSVIIEDDIISYSIPEGERAGIWIARLPP